VASVFDIEKQMTYWLKIFLFSFVPTIGINLLTRPLWSDYVGTNTSLAAFSVILTTGLLPIYLLIVNYYFAKKRKADNFIINSVIIVSCIWLSAYFHFINWADSVGSRSNPDGGTEAIMSFEQWIGTIVVIIGSIIGHFSLARQNKTASH
jgi:hypothetical protein